MPYSCVKSHDGRLEWVVIRNPNVYNICAALVRCTRRAAEGAFEVCEIITITEQIGRNLGEGVALDVGNLFGDAAVAVTHGV